MCQHTKDLYDAAGKMQGSWFIAKHHTGRKVVICAECQKFYGFVGDQEPKKARNQGDES